MCMECSSGETNIAPFEPSCPASITAELDLDVLHENIFYLSVINKINGVKLPVQTVYKHHLL